MEGVYRTNTTLLRYCRDANKNHKFRSTYKACGQSQLGLFHLRFCGKQNRKKITNPSNIFICIPMHVFPEHPYISFQCFIFLVFFLYLFLAQNPHSHFYVWFPLYPQTLISNRIPPMLKISYFGILVWIWFFDWYFSSYCWHMAAVQLQTYVKLLQSQQ